MAKLKKFSSNRNLAGYRVWVTDTDPSSRYFRLAQIPDVLTAGKNAFLINGSEELVATTEVLVELTDVNGESVFLAPIKNFTEGLARVVSIEIYEDTPPGLGTLTILGHLTQDQYGNLPPDEFKTAYNVKWQTQINIAPFRTNITPIRLYRRPTMDVSEMIMPFRSSSVAAPITISTGTVTFSVPSIGSSNALYITSLTPTLNFNRDMVSGSVSATINGQSYTGTITKVINSTVAELDPPISASASGSVASAYSLTYTPAPTFGMTLESRSFADVRLNRLTTFSGEVARTRIYMRSADQTSDFQLVSDLKLPARELSVTSSVLTGEQVIPMGSITSQAILDSYWNSGIIANNAFIPTSSVSLVYTSSISLDSVRLNTGSLNGSYTNPNYFLGIASALPVQAGDEYSINARIVCSATDSFPARMDIVLYGNAFPSSSTEPLGTVVQTYTVPANVARADFGEISENVIAAQSGSVYVRFVVYSGEWHIGSVSFTSADENGFNPDESRILVPVTNRRLETLQFKAELFDANSNLLPVTILSAPTFFTGSNVTIRGTDNKIPGGVEVGVSGSTLISIGSGYTGSAAETYPTYPYIFIGTPNFKRPTYNNPSSSVFIASHPTSGSLMSLGNKLYWDGSQLNIEGSINITSGPTYNTIQQLSSSVAANTSSVASLESRIFTDSTGLFVRPPTASVAGLYLGSKHLGYYNGTSWTTYMSDIGTFFLTGSLGSSHYLAWDGNTLEIAGSINITTGPTLTTINNNTASASLASASAALANTAANAAQNTATQASASAAIASGSAYQAGYTASLAYVSASVVDAKVFTDSTGLISKTPSPLQAGLYLGSTFLGYYSGSSWRTYMSNTGNFFLTGSGGHFLSWNAGTLTIAGSIDIVSGQGRTDINYATSVANTATGSAATAQSTANAATASAANASASAALANTSASLVDAKVFTDSTGLITKPATTATNGLYLGSTFMGYYSGSTWRTYMSNTGNFFLTGSTGDYLAWNSLTGQLTISGQILITGGNAATTTYADTQASNAQSTAISTAASDATTKANNAQSTAISTAASDATTKANNAQSTAISTAASDASTKANNAALSASLVDAKVKTDTVGKIVAGSTTPSSAGLYLSSTYLGFHNGDGTTGGWKAYIKNDGSFYFNGNSTNFISWDTTKLTVKAELFDLSSTGTSTIRMGGATSFGDSGIYMDNSGLFSAMQSSRGLKVNSSYSTVKIEGDLSLWNNAAGAGKLYAESVYIYPALINFATGDQSSPITTIGAGGVSTSAVSASAGISTTYIQTSSQIKVGSNSVDALVAKAKITTSGTPSGTPPGGQGTLWLQVT